MVHADERHRGGGDVAGPADVHEDSVPGVGLARHDARGLHQVGVERACAVDGHEEVVAFGKVREVGADEVEEGAAPVVVRDPEQVDAVGGPRADGEDDAVALPAHGDDVHALLHSALTAVTLFTPLASKESNCRAG